MKSLRHNLRDILSRIRRSGGIVIFLDYDGTLTPIVSNPYKAILSSRLKTILKTLKNNKHVTISIVSGRSLKDIKRLVGIKGIYYAGCHGLEFKKVSDTFCSGVSDTTAFKERLLGELRGIAGVEIEDKGCILALHYRNVKKALIPKLKGIFFSLTAPYVKSKKIKIGKGKMVFEIRPPLDWDKGKFCLYLLNKLERGKKDFLPIYIGDDKTDEDAFKALRKRGITIFVKGEKKSSCAEYFLASQAEVAGLLKLIGDTFHFVNNK